MTCVYEQRVLSVVSPPKALGGGGEEQVYYVCLYSIHGGNELFEQERTRTSELAEIVSLHDDYTPLVERGESGQRPFTFISALYERECMR